MVSITLSLAFVRSHSQNESRGTISVWKWWAVNIRQLNESQTAHRMSHTPPSDV